MVRGARKGYTFLHKVCRLLPCGGGSFHTEEAMRMLAYPPVSLQTQDMYRQRLAIPERP